MASHSSTLAWKIPWTEEPGRLQSMGSRSVRHNWLHFHFSLSCIGEGNGNPLQYSCLENPRDGGAWWAAVYGVTQSQTQLKWLSSSSIYNRKWHNFGKQLYSNKNFKKIKKKYGLALQIELQGKYPASSFWPNCSFETPSRNSGANTNSRKTAQWIICQRFLHCPCCWIPKFIKWVGEVPHFFGF